MLSPAMRCQARVMEFRTALIPTSSRDRHDPGNPVASPAAASPQHSADSEAFKARAGRRAPCTVEPAARHPHIPRLIIHPVRSDLDRTKGRAARAAVAESSLWMRSGSALLAPAGPHTELMASLTASPLGIVS